VGSRIQHQKSHDHYPSFVAECNIIDIVHFTDFIVIKIE